MEMLLKICGSRQGLEVFGVKNNILIILSELLLFAPQVNFISPLTFCLFVYKSFLIYEHRSLTLS